MTLSVLGPSRATLESCVGRRIRVTAVFVAVGKRKALTDPRLTVLVRDVRDADSGEALTDHLWFNRGSVWKAANLTPGDLICFNARSIEYRTGYWGPSKIRQIDAPARRDYRLTPPEGLQVIGRAWRDCGEAA